MYFEIWATKIKLCVHSLLYAQMSNELGSTWTYFYKYDFLAGGEIE